jgi:hypothetical protein
MLLEAFPAQRWWISEHKHDAVLGIRIGPAMLPRCTVGRALAQQ